jgi:hypothetical protein
VKKIIKKFKSLVIWKLNQLKFGSKPKIFCIGLNKTGTTSLKTALRTLGYEVGNQRKAELLLNDWYKRDYKDLIQYCKGAEAFQDVPFSFPFTFIALDQAFL